MRRCHRVVDLVHGRVARAACRRPLLRPTRAVVVVVERLLLLLLVLLLLLLLLLFLLVLLLQLFLFLVLHCRCRLRLVVHQCICRLVEYICVALIYEGVLPAIVRLDTRRSGCQRRSGWQWRFFIERCTLRVVHGMVVASARFHDVLEMQPQALFAGAHTHTNACCTSLEALSHVQHLGVNSLTATRQCCTDATANGWATHFGDLKKPRVGRSHPH